MGIGEMSDVDVGALDAVADRDVVHGILTDDRSVLVRSDRPDELALTLVEALDAEFVDTVDGLAEAIGSRVEVAEARAARAAAEVLAEARAAVEAAETVVAELAAAARSQSLGSPPTDPGGQTGRRPVARSAAPLLLGAGAIGVAGAAGGVPLALAAPAGALVWVAIAAARQRDDRADRAVVAEHLAAVSALADRAYAGVDLHETEELAIARRHLDAAITRRRAAEAAWAGVDGTPLGAASTRCGPLVVFDEAGDIGDEEFAGWTAGLLGDLRVVLVGPERPRPARTV